ncbi:MAG: hypothetical protein ACRDH8_15415 [Actinomycetota bacterium]
MVSPRRPERCPECGRPFSSDTDPDEAQDGICSDCNDPGVSFELRIAGLDRYPSEVGRL